MNAINRTSSLEDSLDIARSKTTQKLLSHIMTPEENQQLAIIGVLFFWNNCSLIFFCGLTGNGFEVIGEIG